MALYFGLDMGFEFGSYSNGPVSDEMANGIYRLSMADKSIYDEAEPYVPVAPCLFMENDFLCMVSGRSPAWLCAAATMLCLNIDYRKDLDWVKDRTSAILKYTSGSTAAIKDAFGELKRKDMFRLD